MTARTRYNKENNDESHEVQMLSTCSAVRVTSNEQYSLELALENGQ